MANALVNQIRNVLGQLYPNDAIAIKKKAQTLVSHKPYVNMKTNNLSFINSNYVFFNSKNYTA